jgi:HK97 family phage major capsid protein
MTLNYNTGNINKREIYKMTLLEIKDERTKLLQANDNIVDMASQDGRAKTEGELGTMQANLRRLKELNIEEETEKFKQPDRVQEPFYILKPERKESFSLLRAIRERVEGRTHNDLTRDIILTGRKDFSKANVSGGGDIVLPFEYRAPIDAKVTGATHGMEIVAEEKRFIMPPLSDKLILAQAGATYMPGLVGNVSIPSYAGTSVAWVAENTAAADGGGLFSEVNFTPKRITAYIDVSKLFLAQDSVGAEKLLLDNISEAVARKIEATILGNVILDPDYPSGIGYKLNVANGGGVAELTGATITYAAMVALETAVDVSNALDGNLAYVTNGIARGILKSTDKGVLNDTGSMIMSDDNFINGYPCLVTNCIASDAGAGGTGNMVAFGNWKDLCIAHWGGYDITIDPYTLAIYNQVRITINTFVDARGLRGETGTFGGADLDEYAYSFAALSIV